MYNDNKHFLTHENVFLIIQESHNENIYFSYARRCIMETNISVIHESIFLIIRDDV